MTIDGADKTTREINTAIKAAVAAGEREIDLLHPAAQHNLAVALLSPVKLTIHGTVGYFCGGLGDGATIHVLGSAGWFVMPSVNNMW